MEIDDIQQIWKRGAAMSAYFPGYTPRKEQVLMSRAVRKAIDESNHLVVEGGTGIGKSLAYLVPAILWSHQTEQTVVISTATINLQQQLLEKDVPNAIKALENAEIIPANVVRYTTMKGKSNYLCSHHANNFINNEDAKEPAQAQLASVLKDWRTHTGDKTELGLTPELNRHWPTVSSQYNSNCPIYHAGGNLDGQTCFILRARERVKNAHLVIVNHALLLSDIANGGGMLGAAPVVIIDEGHQLEEEASRQFGWELTEPECSRRAAELTKDPNIAGPAEELADTFDKFWHQVAQTVGGNPNDDDSTKTITQAFRKSPEWRALERMAKGLTRKLADVLAIMHGQCQIPGRETMLQPYVEYFTTTNHAITGLFDNHQAEFIQWLRVNHRGHASINSVPLKVAPYINSSIFQTKRSVIVTSATLTTGAKDFSLIRSQIGFPKRGVQLALDSPFDYRRQAQFLIPEDISEPRQFREFRQDTAQAVYDIASQLSGHTLALFTSYSSLSDCDGLIRPQLEAKGIKVLAQGVDGTADAIIRDFRDNPQSVILGTQSFWQGVDLSEDQLHAVIVCRLPFPVPTDPVIEARSELYGNAFSEYHIPIAALRLRQGCGRLIRNHNSKGSIIILDRRMLTMRYGAVFADSLPDYNTQRSNMSTLGTLAHRWVEPKQPVAAG